MEVATDVLNKTSEGENDGKKEVNSKHFSKEWSQPKFQCSD